jgi:hypothetical protein
MELCPVADDEDMITRYLATKGVTRCPTACVAETSAMVGEKDRIAVAVHHDRVAAALRAEFEERMKEKLRHRIEHRRVGLERCVDRMRRRIGAARWHSDKRPRQI